MDPDILAHFISGKTPGEPDSGFPPSQPKEEKKDKGQTQQKSSDVKSKNKS